MTLWLLAIGAISMLGQVVLLRELNVAFFGSELVYILALGAWMGSTAAGAVLGRRAHLPTGREVRLLFVVLALVLPAVAILGRGLRPLLGGVPGAYLPFPRQIAALGLALLPVGLALGLLFQWTAKLFAAEGRTLARAYAVESAGGMVGGGLATLLLKCGVQNLTAALLCGLLSLVAACHPWRRERPRFLVPAVVGAALTLGLALAWRDALDRATTAWTHPALVASRDSPYSRVTVTEAAGQVSVFENDALAFESQGTAAEEFVHLAAVQHASVESALVLGGGVEGLVQELLRHRPARIDYVELDGVLLALLASHLPGDVGRSLADESVHVVVADPRRFLAEPAGYGGSAAAAGPVTYDLILVGMPDPDSGRANRFFTREFFAQCAARLRPGGVLALRLRGAENIWTPQLARRAASIERALGAVFADVVVLPGVTDILIASQAPLARDPEALAARLGERGIRARLVTPAYIRYLYTNDRFAETAALLSRTRAPVNSDIHPVCYQYTLLLWLSKFFPVLALLDVSALDAAGLRRAPLAWLSVAIVVIVLVLCRRSRRSRRALLVASAGFAGFVLETALLLHFQSTNGVLYQDLGLLLTLFMAGLALGAAAVDALVRAGRMRPTRLAGMVLLAALGGTSLLVGRSIEAGAVHGLAGTALLLLACGFLVAAVFAYAGLHGQPDQRAVVSLLYAADLLGGCVGSLAAGLFLAPAAGTAGSALLMAPVVLSAALFL